MDNKGLKLHLGCGRKKLPGWVNIDSVPALKPDMVLDISRPLPFADGSVSEVLAEDLLEHFDKYMRYIIFYQWTKVLKDGGIVTLQVPNLKKILWRYFKFGFDKFTDHVFGETLWMSEDYIGHYGSHKWGYSPESLKEFVKIFHVTPLKVTCPGLNIRLVGRKDKGMTDEEFGQLKVCSIINEKEYPLAFVRDRIQKFQEK